MRIVKGPYTLLIYLVVKLFDIGLGFSVHADTVEDNIARWQVMIRENSISEARASARRFLAAQGPDTRIIRFLAGIESDPIELRRLLQDGLSLAPPLPKPLFLR